MNIRKHAVFQSMIWLCVLVAGCGRATQNVRELLKALKYGTPKEKARAEKALVEASVMSIDPVCEVLENSELKDMHRQMASILGRIASRYELRRPHIERAAKALVYRLCGDVGPDGKLHVREPDPEIRLAVIAALGQLGTVPDVDAAAMLEDTQAVEALMACLTDEDERVQMSAVDALSKLGYAAAPDVAEATKTKDEPLLGNAKTCAANLVKALVAQLADKKLELSTRVRIIDGLGHLQGDKAMKALIPIMANPEADVELRRAAAEALSRWPENKLNYLKQRFLDVLDEEDNDSRLCLYAAKALGQIGDVFGLEYLIRLLTDKDDQVRLEATDALGTLGVAAVPYLARIATMDTNKTVRLGLVDALANIGGEDVVPVLIDRFENDSERDVRLAALVGLAKCNAPSAVPPLIRALDSTDKEISKKAATALSEVGAGVLPALNATIATREEDDETIAKIQEAAQSIVDALGAGLASNIYRQALMSDLAQAEGVVVESAPAVKVEYQDKVLGTEQADMVVNGNVVVKVKVANALGEADEGEVLSYLKRAKKFDLGVIVNFGASSAVVQRVGVEGVRVRPEGLPLIANVIGATGDASSIIPLLVGARRKDPAVKESVLRALRRVIERTRDKIKDPSVIVTRIEALLAEQSPLPEENEEAATENPARAKARAAMLIPLGSLGTPQAVQLIVRYLVEDTDPGVRQSAATALTLMPDYAKHPLDQKLLDAAQGQRALQDRAQDVKSEIAIPARDAIDAIQNWEQTLKPQPETPAQPGHAAQ